MGYHLRLIQAFIRTSFQRETNFRSNFYINLLNTCLNLVSGLAGVSILFGQVESFQGWTYGQALTLLGVFMIVGRLLDINLWPSLNTLGGLDGEIWQGSFDFTLLKPLNTQFYISFRIWDLWQLVDLVLGLAVLGWGVSLLEQPLKAGNLLWFVLMLLVAVILGYAILLILETGAFYYLGAPLTWIFSALMSMGRYPITIYPGWVRLALTWIVPLGFMVTVPTQVLIGAASPMLVIGGIIFAAVLFWLSALIFRRSLKRYASASS